MVMRERTRRSSLTSTRAMIVCDSLAVSTHPANDWSDQLVRPLRRLASNLHLGHLLGRGRAGENDQRPAVAHHDTSYWGRPRRRQDVTRRYLREAVFLATVSMSPPLRKRRTVMPGTALTRWSVSKPRRGCRTADPRTRCLQSGRTRRSRRRTQDSRARFPARQERDTQLQSRS